jgi:hypothetical protein
MKMFFNCLGFFTVVVLCFTACGNSEKSPVKVPDEVLLEISADDTVAVESAAVAVDVYIISNDGDISQLWKNGEILQTSGIKSNFTSIFVDGSDLYVAGHSDFGFHAYFSKNGDYQTLISGDDNAGWTNSIYVSGSDVYVTGSSYNNATLWKNGVAKNLGKGSANSVFVSGNDVYVAGSSNDNAMLWKNGDAQSLGTGGAYSVFVSGNDVYVAGSDNNDAILWKNGAAQTLGEGYANSVFIYANDVYVVGLSSSDGRNSDVILWKNSRAQNLGQGWASSVFVSGNDVYVAGGRSLWKNSVIQNIDWYNNNENIFNSHILIAPRPDYTFPLEYIGTWKRDNYDNTLTFSKNTITISSRTNIWELMGISGDSFSLKREGASQFTIPIRLTNNSLVITGDTGTGQENWNGTWLRQ